MIIGKNKQAVIENIQRAVQEEQFQRKVEVDDPGLSAEEEQKILSRFPGRIRTAGYHLKNKAARGLVEAVTRGVNRNTEITGLEHLRQIHTGAIITSNHFNPLDNTAVRSALKKAGKNRLYIVSQAGNFAMKGVIGFVMNYADTIPLGKDQDYMTGAFPDLIRGLLRSGQYVLIYPEQEMWFNYRKPRPLKRGAYYYAARFHVPVISCFVEQVEIKEKENDEFNKVRYVVHILEPIFPDPQKSVRENSMEMMNRDYEQKRLAYEKAYGRKLTYEFEPGDIAGWRYKWKNSKDEPYASRLIRSL